MSEIEKFLTRLETISEILVPDWRQIATGTFPKIDSIFDFEKLLAIDARHNLCELLRASKLDESEKELVKFKKHKLHQNKALKKYRNKSSNSSNRENEGIDQLIRERDELIDTKRDLIWEKIYFQTLMNMERFPLQ